MHQEYRNIVKGVCFVGVFAALATYVAGFSFFQTLQISPLIVGLVLGIIFANTLRHHIPESWGAGIKFSGKMILRAAIVFYGFRLTFQDIMGVGGSGVLISALMVSLTFLLGYIVGIKILKMDREMTILTCAGSAICGAAAVLATESVIKAKAHHSALAVAGVVLFGTTAMFLYPFMFRMGFIPMDSAEMGIYIGASVHEVAHVVAAGNGIGDAAAANAAVIVKMIRVMLIAPFLLILGLWWRRKYTQGGASTGPEKLYIPWFAVMFIAMAGFNSLDLLPQKTVGTINMLDGFALTMAMSALGLETNLKKFKEVGFKPVLLAFILFLWLIFGGFAVTKGVLAIF